MSRAELDAAFCVGMILIIGLMICACLWIPSWIRNAGLRAYAKAGNLKLREIKRGIREQRKRERRRQPIPSVEETFLVAPLPGQAVGPDSYTYVGIDGQERTVFRGTQLYDQIAESLRRS